MPQVFLGTREDCNQRYPERADDEPPEIISLKQGQMAAAEEYFGDEVRRQVFASQGTGDKVSWNYETMRLNRTVFNTDHYAAHVRVPAETMDKPDPEDDQPGLSKEEVTGILQQEREADFARERPASQERLLVPDLGSAPVTGRSNPEHEAWCSVMRNGTGQLFRDKFCQWD